MNLIAFDKNILKVNDKYLFINGPATAVPEYKARLFNMRDGIEGVEYKIGERDLYVTDIQVFANYKDEDLEVEILGFLVLVGSEKVLVVNTHGESFTLLENLGL